MVYYNTPFPHNVGEGGIYVFLPPHTMCGGSIYIFVYFSPPHKVRRGYLILPPPQCGGGNLIYNK